MIVVLFQAEVREVDEDYIRTGRRLRELAQTKYGCLGMVSAAEGGREIAVSYWRSREDLLRWKNDPEHRRAQALARERWYRSYKVQVLEMLYEYAFSAAA
ncbi:MAG: antibiotic biosynthesis monooxygenase [Chloroflexi bacterium]|nr:antibiotic biosynthesis monooxygenase [Chloroflexota bacterium]